MLQTILFWVLFTGSMVGAIGMVFNRTPIYSVLWAILNFFCLGGLYLTLQAEFIAVIQIIVYAGAIMVLFLFVIMLLNLGKETPESFRFDVRKGLAFVLGAAFVGELAWALNKGLQMTPVDQTPAKFSYGQIEPLGMVLMTDYMLPFELISVVLLAALLGAIVIAKKHN